MVHSQYRRKFRDLKNFPKNFPDLKTIYITRGYTMKFPIIIENSRIPKLLSIFIDIWAITIWPFIICKGVMNKVTLNHEKIHIRQQAELLLIGFYLLYAYYWLKARLWYKLDNHTAYMAIPFEIEAYDNEENEGYLKDRKWFAWWGYR